MRVRAIGLVDGCESACAGSTTLSDSVEAGWTDVKNLAAPAGRFWPSGPRPSVPIGRTL